MTSGWLSDAYLSAVPSDVAERLRAANADGMGALSQYLQRREAIAFLGAGASAPLYPLWTELIGDLISNAENYGLDRSAAKTCHALANRQPEAVVEIVRKRLGDIYFSVISETFGPRWDAITGLPWTLTHELVSRCAFKGVITTNYDAGIVDARDWVRPRHVATKFSTWLDERAFVDWRMGAIFGGDELPIQFAHGHYHRPESVVLASAEYRKAYASELVQLLADAVNRSNLVWIGFSFSDRRIANILLETELLAVSKTSQDGEPRHVAIMPWDPETDESIEVLDEIARIEYGSRLVLYPAPDGDHSALDRLLAEFTLPEYAWAPPDATDGSPPAIAVHWDNGARPVSGFGGRIYELAKLTRLTADLSVRLVAITGLGGAGKTALVSEWLNQAKGAVLRPGIRGVFWWSFYENPSIEDCTASLLGWAHLTFEFVHATQPDPSKALHSLLSAVPLVLILDGLEVLQAGRAETQFGHLNSQVLRDLLQWVCSAEHGSLVVTTSRFWLADVAKYDGLTARIFDVPELKSEEATDLLGASELTDEEVRRLVALVRGHAMTMAVLNNLLTRQTGPDVVTKLRSLIAEEYGTSRADVMHLSFVVSRIFNLYAEQLSEPDRLLVAAVSLFAKPVSAADITKVLHESFGGRFRSWDADAVRAAARGPLSGLLTLHPDDTISAHPIVRETFRPLARGVQAQYLFNEEDQTRSPG